MQLTECEVPWLEDGEIHHSPQARSTPMSEKPISPMRQRMIESRAVCKFRDKTQNDYIPRVKTFSTLLLLPDVASPLDLLTPFSSTTDT
jgi:hypothetical protein